MVFTWHESNSTVQRNCPFGCCVKPHSLRHLQPIPPEPRSPGQGLLGSIPSLSLPHLHLLSKQTCSLKPPPMKFSGCHLAQRKCSEMLTLTIMHSALCTPFWTLCFLRSLLSAAYLPLPASTCVCAFPLFPPVMLSV